MSLALLLLAAGCTQSAGGKPAPSSATAVPSPPSSPRSPGERHLAGSWGGRGAGLTIPDGENARVEFDCAHGSIERPLAVTVDGDFEWRGTFVRERGGPMRSNGGAAAPARYRGHIDGDTMTLTVEPARTDRPFGPLVLTRGETPRIRKCA